MYLPKVRNGADHVYHQFVIRCNDRERLQKYLMENGLNTMVHYPIPPHLSKVYSWMNYKQGDFPITERYADEVVSLPLYPGLKKEEITYVCEILAQFK